MPILENRPFDIYTFQEKGIKIVYLDALFSRVEGDVGVFLCHRNDQNYWYQIVLACDSGKHHFLDSMSFLHFLKLLYQFDTIYSFK